MRIKLPHGTTKAKMIRGPVRLLQHDYISPSLPGEVLSKMRDRKYWSKFISNSEMLDEVVKLELENIYLKGELREAIFKISPFLDRQVLEHRSNLHQRADFFPADFKNTRGNDLSLSETIYALDFDKIESNASCSSYSEELVEHYLANNLRSRKDFKEFSKAEAGSVDPLAYFFLKNPEIKGANKNALKRCILSFHGFNESMSIDSLKEFLAYLLEVGEMQVSSIQKWARNIQQVIRGSFKTPPEDLNYLRCIVTHTPVDKGLVAERVKKLTEHYKTLMDKGLIEEATFILLSFSLRLSAYTLHLFTFNMAKDRKLVYWDPRTSQHHSMELTLELQDAIDSYKLSFGFERLTKIDSRECKITKKCSEGVFLFTKSPESWNKLLRSGFDGKISGFDFTGKEIIVLGEKYSLLRENPMMSSHLPGTTQIELIDT